MLAPYLADPSNLFIVSSDFCHWGARFNFTFYDEHQVRHNWQTCDVLQCCPQYTMELWRCHLLSITRLACRGRYTSPSSG